MIPTVKGMNDILPVEVATWQMIELIGRKLFENFGYREIRTPILEKTELFVRGVGKETDVVRKEMYTFLDKDGESLSLRPEGTASVVRAYIQHNLVNEDPVTKLYYWGPMFRRERPQKGRLRQFYQFGVEVIGVSDPLVDAELIFMLDQFYGLLGVEDLSIRINSLGCKDCRPDFRSALVKYFSSKKESMCPDCHRRLEQNPLRILDCKVEGCRELAKNSPCSVDTLCDPCRKHFQGVIKGLEFFRVSFELDPRIVRGFDYYTRTAFEITSSKLGAQDAVGGGGRYDNLIEELGGAPTPAIGYSGGIDRLTLIMPAVEAPGPSLYIVWLGEEAKVEALKNANKLRLMGINVEMGYEEKSIKSQMRRSDKLKSKYVLVLGSDELKKKSGKLKEMASGKEIDVDLKTIDDLKKILEEI
ncbi:MAG: histidine--tRNA ligase [Deltaproteobacteria bacterium RIFCSPHIGHO2_12_FULL_43_9]|nr:MAG: histidine--tRNA ligase [Deltaproteobacteria bacterium RIFCSPHIGHO2_12_FULL_43_9]